jgi:hypothetical protein
MMRRMTSIAVDCLSAGREVIDPRHRHGIAAAPHFSISAGGRMSAPLVFR